jgi:hypothetical protein
MRGRCTGQHLAYLSITIQLRMLVFGRDFFDAVGSCHAGLSGRGDIRSGRRAAQNAEQRRVALNEVAKIA